jgi:hypothetical protein
MWTGYKLTLKGRGSSYWSGTATGPTPEHPVRFGSNAPGREADHGVFTQARSSTMEPKNGSGREEKKAEVP